MPLSAYMLQLLNLTAQEVDLPFVVLPTDPGIEDYSA